MVTIPKPFYLESPSVLRVKEGGGCLSVFGLPFLGAGLWMLGLAVGLAPLGHQHRLDGASAAIIALMGFVFTAVGGGLVFGRKWIVIDKVRRQFVVQYGLLFPMKKQTRSLGDFSKVLLGFQQGDADSADRYPVTLVGQEKGRAQNITTSLQFKNAREQALYLSSFLHLPFEDASTDQVDIANPWAHAASHGDAAPSGLSGSDPADVRTDVSCPSRPAVMSCLVEDGPQGLKITVPKSGLSIFHVVFSFIPALFGYFFFRGALTKETLDYHKPENAFLLFFIGFFTLFFVVIPVVSAYRRFRKMKTGLWSATLTRDSLVIDDAATNASGTYRIARGNILSIQARVVSLETNPAPLAKSPRLRGGLVRMMQRQNALVVKTKEDILTFPLGLPKEEMDYLCHVLSQKINPDLLKESRELVSPYGSETGG